METYLIYIGKSALAAGTFYLLYLALFQHQKHFVFNRIYLPVSLTISFLIPLITFTTINYIQPAQSVNTTSFAYLPEVPEMAESELIYQWYHYLFGIYLLGVLGFLFHLVLGHIKAFAIIRFSRIKELFGVRVNVSKKDIHPFSFFNKIVLSEKTLDNPHLKIIVDHEMIHVKERHTLDILFAEVLFLFQWFNPFAWLIKDAMRNNLEFLTDDQIAQTNNAETYQLTMIGLAHKEGVAPFLNALNGSQLKNRIIMMKKKTENKYSLLKQFLVLPLLAVLVMGLSNKKVEVKIIESKTDANISIEEELIQTDYTDLKAINFSEDSVKEMVIMRTDKFSISGIVVDNLGNSISNATILNYQSSQKFATNKHGEFNLEFNGITEPIILSCSAANYHPNDIVYYGNKKHLKIMLSEFNSDKKIKLVGTVTNEKGEPIASATVIIKGTTTGTITNMNGDFIIESESEIETLAFAMIGYEKKEVSVGKDTNLKVELKVDENSKTKIGYRAQNTTDFQIKDTFKNSGTPLYIVDGKETKSIENLDSNEIESVSVLKDESATSLYGAKGKNGVVLITTKAVATVKTKEKVKVVGYGKQKDVSINEDVQERISNDLGKTPLYIIDGKETKGFNINSLDKNNIEQITIIKAEGATNLYKEKGKDGAVLITTKDAATVKTKEGIKVVGYGTQIKPTTVDSHIEASKTVFLKSKKGEDQPLYIVDGKEIEDLDNLQPSDIESVSVLKDESATSLYGAKGKNGIILITTKDAAANKMRNAIVIVDGKKYDGDVSDIDPENIESVDVLKNESATKLYGPKAKDGAIIIKSKNALNFNDKKPLLFVDGVPYPGEVNDINPENIKSIDVIKDASAIAKYGDAGKDGVTIITTKSKEITTELELRKFIAKSIKYPAAAQKANKQDTVKLFVKVNADGIIYSVSEEAVANAIFIDEVVVVGYSSENPVATGYATKNEVSDLGLVAETKRVINQLPTLKVANYKGKTLAITVKFELQ